MRATEHIASVRIPFEIPLPTGARLRRYVYSHIVHGEDACIIDAAVAGSAEAIIGLLKESSGNASRSRALLLTHTHPDHIGSARTLKERLGLAIGCPSGEVNWIEDVQGQMRDRPVPGMMSLVEGSVKVDFRVDDGLEIDLGGVTVRVIATPGHSPASTSYEVVEDGAIISGDAIPLLTEPPIYDDALASLASIKRLRLRAPQHLIPSWHEPMHGASAENHIADGEEAIVRFHDAVANVLKESPELDDERACAQVLSALGFAPDRMNPLTVRTFRAHRRALADWPGR